MESEHKLLVPMLNMKHLDDIPPQVLRFWSRLAKYAYVLYHIPGYVLYVADAHSKLGGRR